jgi:hypothetical protein
VKKIQTSLRFSADPSDPNGTAGCETCHGTAVVGSGRNAKPCPDCAKRQNRRSTHWDQQLPGRR